MITNILKGGSWGLKAGSLTAFCLLLLAGTPGCTSWQLRHNTVAQNQTVMDLEYQMVLANVAMFSQAPDSLPWHLHISQGVVTMNDSVGLSLGYTSKKPASAALPAAVTGTTGGSASRSWQGQWTVLPVVDTKQLKKLEVLYNQVINHTWKMKNGQMPPADWFHKGVSPRGLDCPSGNYGTTYIWVDDANLDKLAELTRQVLDDTADKTKGALMGVQVGPTVQIQ